MPRNFYEITLIVSLIAIAVIAGSMFATRAHSTPTPEIHACL